MLVCIPPKTRSTWRCDAIRRVLVHNAEWQHEGMNLVFDVIRAFHFFFRVSATRLLYKFLAFGLHRDLFGTVQSWLRNRQAFVVVTGNRFAGSVCANMVYQSTIQGPTVWNACVGGVLLMFVWAEFYIVIYADDLNAFQVYVKGTANILNFDDLRSRQGEFHKCGRANQVTFETGKQHFGILSKTNAAGDSFKVISYEFDCKLLMRLVLIFACKKQLGATVSCLGIIGCSRMPSF